MISKGKLIERLDYLEKKLKQLREEVENSEKVKEDKKKTASLYGMFPQLRYLTEEDLLNVKKIWNREFAKKIDEL